MKKNLIFIFIISIAFVSCDSVYINGELDGMWQLRRVQYIDRTLYPADEYPDATPQDIYYSFQQHLVLLGIMSEDSVPVRYLGNLEYKKMQSVTIGGFRKFMQEEQAATLDDLRQFMLYDTLTIFEIIKLDDDILQMNSKGIQYTLRKW